jgi:CubicO group peptidase (beta-lactamase class C family)
MFTAAIAMQLYQQGRLDFDAPLNAYLPEALIQGIHVYKGVDYSHKLLVSHLIDHSSGLADHETDKLRSGQSLVDQLKAGQDRYIETAEAMQLTRGLPPHFAPGAPGKGHYSNGNYRLLGAIIEAITGCSMAQNFQAMICAPLGLTETYLFDWTTPRHGVQPADIYLKHNVAHVPKYLSSNTSDGGIVSTVSESIAFLRAFFEGRLFDKSLLERMMHWKSIFFPMKYGYGLMYFKLPRFFSITPPPEFMGHSGSTGSFAFVSPSRSLYLAGTINQIANPAGPFRLMMELVRAVGSK